MIVVDTDLLIDFLHKREPATAFLTRAHEAGEPLATTCVNAAELLRGAQSDADALAKTSKLLTAFADIPLGPLAARRFGELMHALDRAGSPISTTDGLIAAIALTSGAKVATRNARDYRRVAGLEVVVPK